MLSWTDSGAVKHPETVQVRVQRSYPGRIRAGAPVPTRSMTDGEIRDNLRWFTRTGPRDIPCTSLVLSGVGVAARPELPGLLDFARERGVATVVLHVGGEDLEDLQAAPLAGRVDMLVLPVQPSEVHGGLEAGARAVRTCAANGIEVAVNTVLDSRAVDRLPAVARAIARAAPTHVTFTYPFPINGDQGQGAPPVPRSVTMLKRAVPLLREAGIQPRIKGLPACHLGELAPLLAPSQNRWYVDADHQAEKALLFFPDVVAFYKDEICRFCWQDPACDGFFATYLRRPGCPPLDPAR